MVLTAKKCLEPLKALIPFLILAFFLYKWLKPTLISSKKLPPYPPKLPFLGNIHQLRNQLQLHRNFDTLSKQYGELMLLHLGSTPVLIVSSERTAREIFKKHDAIFSNRLTTRKANKLLYNGKGVVLSPYGEHWRQMKSICTIHILSNQRVRSFRNVREEETLVVIEKIIQARNSRVNLSEIFIEFANNMICKVAFGRKYTKDEDGTDLGDLIKTLTKALAELTVGDFIPSLSWIDRLNGWNARNDRIAVEFDSFIEKVVQEHRDRVDECRKCEDKDETPIKDFVDVLLDIQKDGKIGNAHIPLDTESIKGFILDMFVGGAETTSTLLEWIMTELLRNPQVMQEAQKEAREITRNHPCIKEEELEKTKYLKAVIRETFRLHPPAPLLVPRQTTRETKVDGYDIPAGTACFINVWSIHRDTASWDEPDKYNPNRFLNSAIDFRGHDFQFIPFGAGRRMCPGISFSMASIELLLANIINKFDWEIPEGEIMDMSEHFRISLHRRTPLFAFATPHDFS